MREWSLYALGHKIRQVQTFGLGFWSIARVAVYNDSSVGVLKFSKSLHHVA